MIRSNLLTHWTGKYIETHADNLNDEKRQKYLERLRSILKGGLWMTLPSEKLTGWSPGAAHR